MTANLIITATTFSIMLVMALIGNARFQAHERLPMNWGLNGKVNSTGPRFVALGVMPLVGVLTLGLIGYLAATEAPIEGQEGLILPITLFAAAAMIASYALQLWLTARHLRKNGSVD